MHNKDFLTLKHASLLFFIILLQELMKNSIATDANIPSGYQYCKSFFTTGFVWFGGLQLLII